MEASREFEDFLSNPEMNLRLQLSERTKLYKNKFVEAYQIKNIHSINLPLFKNLYIKIIPT